MHPLHNSPARQMITANKTAVIGAGMGNIEFELRSDGWQVQDDAQYQNSRCKGPWNTWQAQDDPIPGQFQ